MPPLLSWLALFGNLVFALVLLGIIARLACKVVVVRGESMMPTLVEGDYLLVFDWWPKDLLRKGQLVVSKSLQAVIKDSHVKRIVATASETVALPLSAIPKANIPQKLSKHYDEQEMRIWQIPPRHVFVRGDNRAHSVDSVMHGPLPFEKIDGVVFMKLPWTFLLFPNLQRKCASLI